MLHIPDKLNKLNSLKRKKMLRVILFVVHCRSTFITWSTQLQKLILFKCLNKDKFNADKYESGFCQNAAHFF